MGQLWEQNRPLIIVAAACALVLLIVRPTVLDTDPPLARWMGTAWKGRHDDLEARRNELREQLNQFYPEAGGAGISDIEARVEKNNLALRQNFDEYVLALSFIPHRPFLPPADRPERDWGHYFREILTRTRDSLLQYCSFRFVQVGENLGFGDFDKEGRVPEGRDVPGLLRDLAAVETLVKHCADSHVEFTQVLSRGPRVSAGTAARAFVWEYPMKVKLRTGYRELQRLFTALNGLHGLVKDVEVNKPRDIVEKVTLNIGSAHGVRRDDAFTIFKRSQDKPCELRYAGRVTVISVSETESVARLDEDSLPYDRFDAALKDSLCIQRGDCATNGFFRVAHIDLRTLPGSVEAADADGIPTKIIPHLLDVTLDVDTIEFDPSTEYVTARNVKGGPVTRPPRTGSTGTRTTGSGVPPIPGGVRRSF